MKWSSACFPGIQELKTVGLIKFTAFLVTSMGKTVFLAAISTGVKAVVCDLSLTIFEFEAFLFCWFGEDLVGVTGVFGEDGFVGLEGGGQ